MKIIVYFILTISTVYNSATQGFNVKENWATFNNYNSNMPTGKPIKMVEGTVGSWWYKFVSAYHSIFSLVRFNGRNFTVFNDENTGLGLSTMIDFDVDSKGNVWLIFADTLAKYDGKVFSTYHIVIDKNDNYPSKIAVDSKDSIWIYTRYPVSKDSADGYFKLRENDWVLQKNRSSTMEDGIAPLVKDKSGNIWINGGEDYFDGENWKKPKEKLPFTEKTSAQHFGYDGTYYSLINNSSGLNINAWDPDKGIKFHSTIELGDIENYTVDNRGYLWLVYHIFRSVYVIYKGVLVQRFDYYDDNGYFFNPCGWSNLATDTFGNIFFNGVNCSLRNNINVFNFDSLRFISKLKPEIPHINFTYLASTVESNDSIAFYMREITMPDIKIRSYLSKDSLAPEIFHENRLNDFDFDIFITYNVNEYNREYNYYFTCYDTLTGLESDKSIIVTYENIPSSAFSKYDNTITGSDDSKIVKSITKDKNGTIWFSKNNELLNFDGSQWERVDQVNGDNLVIMSKLFKDSKGDLWLGCKNSVLKYDGKKWFTYNEQQNVQDITEWNNKISILSRNSIYSFNDAKWDTLLNNYESPLYRVFTDNNDNLWSIGEGFLLLYKNGSWEKSDIPDSLGNSNIPDVILKENNEIIILNGNIIKFDGKNFERDTSAYYVPSTYYVPSINNLNIIDGEYVGAAGDKIYTLRKNGYKVFFTKKLDGTGGKVSNLFFDEGDGSLWVSIENRGIFRIKNWGTPVSVPEEIRTTLNASLFPNPGNNIIEIQLAEDLQPGARLMVYSMLGGKKFQARNIEGNSIKIDVSGYPPRVYFYKLISGGKLNTGKFIVGR